jgi:hypothetical protein
MANPTTNYNFAMPTNTDLVKDLPADFEVFGQAVDTQMKTNADAAIAKTIVDAKGDLIAATAADTVARLAVGTNGQALIADSTAATGMKWDTPSSGGMTLISTTTLSGTSTVLSSIPSGYNSIQVWVYGITHSSSADTLYVNPNGSRTISTTSGSRTGNSAVENYTSSDFRPAGSSTNAPTGVSFIMCEFFNYASASTYKSARGCGGNSTEAGSASGFINTAAAITSLTIRTENSRSFTGGTVLLYGVK